VFKNFCVYTLVAEDYYDLYTMYVFMVIAASDHLTWC